jgi:hypothetical protein
LTPAQPEGAAVSARITAPAGRETSLLSLLQIDFDQPIDLKASFPFFQSDEVDVTGMNPNGLLPIYDYDSNRRRLTIPFVSKVGKSNQGKISGLVANGRRCEPIHVNYAAQKGEYSPELRAQLALTAKDPRLQQLLSDMKRARQKNNSGRVLVQGLACGSADQGGYRTLTSAKSHFKWQGKNQVYADITDVMSPATAFVCGSDGEKCWIFSENSIGKQQQFIPVSEMDEKSYQVADPFNLQSISEAEAIQQGLLAYVDKTELNGRACHLVQGWQVTRINDDFACVFKMQWWIDAATLLPIQTSLYELGGQRTYVFQYESLNEPLAAREFQPSHPEAIDSKLYAKNLTGDKFFLRICDGSDGLMSCWMGVRNGGNIKGGGLH